MSDFERCLLFVLPSEVEPGETVLLDRVGPRVTNDPDDPGGATNDGITQEDYDAWRERHKLFGRHVGHMTASERNAVYKEHYWDRLKCDGMDWPLNLIVFDYAVNSGAHQAAKDLQRALVPYYHGAIDGLIGLGSLSAIGAACGLDGNPKRFTFGGRAYVGDNAIAADVLNRRLDLLARAIQRNSALKKFMRGWARRVRRLEDVLRADAASRATA